MRPRFLLMLTCLLMAARSQLAFAQAEGRSKPGPVRFPAVPPVLSSTVAFQDADGNGFLDAEETGTLKVSIGNRGRGDALRLQIKVTPLETSRELELPTGADVPLLVAGEETTVELPISASLDVPEQTVRLKIEVLDPTLGADADPVVLTFQTRPLQPPELALAEPGIDDDEEGASFGNNNGRVEPGETVEVTVAVQNLGTGTAEQVTADVDVQDEHVFIQDPKRRFEVGAISPNRWKKFTFALFISKRFDGQTVPVEVRIAERRPRFSTHKTLQLPLHIRARKIHEVVIAGQEEESTPSLPGASRPELVADVDRDIPQTQVEKPHAVAVVIGISKYQDPDVPAVDYALRDAYTVRDYLVRTLGYRPENIIFRTNEQASFAEFRNIFEGRLPNFLDPQGRSEVFIYYSGHGAPDLESQQGYVVPYDCDPAFVKVSGYALDRFYENVNRLNARTVTVVLDACFSGVSQGGTLLQQASPIYIRIKHPLLRNEKTTLFASSQGDQISSWYGPKKHGLFTYFLLKGLRGEGDRDGDDAITVQELGDYVREHVPYMARRLHNREQTPEVVTSDPHRILVHY